MSRNISHVLSRFVFNLALVVLYCNSGLASQYLCVLDYTFHRLVSAQCTQNSQRNSLLTGFKKKAIARAPLLTPDVAP